MVAFDNMLLIIELITKMIHTAEQLSELSVVQLKDILRKYRMGVSGRKQDLIKRILRSSSSSIVSQNSVIHKMFNVPRTKGRRILRACNPKNDSYEDSIRRMISREENIAGVFRRLLFTHNTPYSTLLRMLSNEYKQNVRCCDENGTPIGRGAQFRHGLDSQYGDVIFIMKPERKWWMNKTGVDVDGHKRSSPNLGRFFSKKHPILDYKTDKRSIEKALEQEALMFTFRNKKLRGDGTECEVSPTPNLTWCFSQLHLGENIGFSHVYKILVPRWIIDNSPTMLDGKDREGLKILKKILKGTYESNISDKLVLYGPSTINKFYDYISPTMEFMEKLIFYPGFSRKRNKITHTTRDPEELGSSSILSLSGEAYRQAEKIYFNAMVDLGMVSKKIKVLSYNVYWKAMTSKIDVCSKGKCLQNIGNFINRKNYDFICLQESTSHEKIKYDMNIAFKEHKSLDESITTYYDKNKYNPIQSIRGETEPGRPYIITRFRMRGYEPGHVIVMNIHNGHSPDQDSSFINSILAEKLPMLKYSPSRDIMIFAGDFNRERINISYKEIPFQEKISAPTCCTNVSTLQGKHKEVYDHILVHGQAKLESTETMTPGDKHSDHLPVVSTISFD